MSVRSPAWFHSALLFGALALGAFASCKTNHDDFKRAAPATAGAGGQAGGAGANAGGSGAVDSGSDADSGEDSGPPEPPGPNVLTFVHGVVDAQALAVCFGKVTDGGVEPIGAPYGGAPLPYGGAFALGSLAGFDFASDSVVPLLIAGDLTSIANLDCAAAVALAEQTERTFDASMRPEDAGAGEAGASGVDAGPPDGGGAPDGGFSVSALRARALPAIPPGTLTGGRSYLLVATGCMGGLGFDAGSATLFCGDSYTPTTPTLFPVLVTISRLTNDFRVGLQVVNASRANGSVGASITRAPPANTNFQIVAGLRVGQLGPKPPFFDQPATDYGADNVIQLASAGAQYGVTIADALAGGGASALVDGASYALIALGPRFDYPTPPPLWNPPHATIVPTSPAP